MISDAETVKRLNLLRSSRSFTLREISGDGSADVLSPKLIPDSNGIYWVSGSTRLKNGMIVDSVFRIDTDSGATLLGVFWWLDGRWFRQDEQDALGALRASRSEVFPFDWTFSIPVQKDAFHS